MFIRNFSLSHYFLSEYADVFFFLNIGSTGIYFIYKKCGSFLKVFFFVELFALYFRLLLLDIELSTGF